MICPNSTVSFIAFFKIVPNQILFSLNWINSTNSYNVCVRFGLKLAVHLWLGLPNNPFYLHFLSTDTFLCTFNSFLKHFEGPSFCTSFILQPKIIEITRLLAVWYFQSSRYFLSLKPRYSHCFSSAFTLWIFPPENNIWIFSHL